MYHPKVPYFFFSPAKFIFYTFLGKTDWMNEKAVFFFFRDRKKKKTAVSFEWMNGLWTLPDQKKKKTGKISKNLQKWTVFFFFRSAGKKKKQDSEIWMNEWPTNFSAEKKKYGTFDVVLSKVWFCISKFKAVVRLRDVPFGREHFKARG